MNWMLLQETVLTILKIVKSCQVIGNTQETSALLHVQGLIGRNYLTRSRLMVLLYLLVDIRWTATDIIHQKSQSRIQIKSKPMSN